MESMQAHEVMARVKATPFEPRFKHIKGRYLFVIESVGEWRVHVDAGHVKVFDGPGDADCTVRCSAEDFVRFAKGE